MVMRTPLKVHIVLLPSLPLIQLLKGYVKQRLVQKTKTREPIILLPVAGIATLINSCKVFLPVWIALKKCLRTGKVFFTLNIVNKYTSEANSPSNRCNHCCLPRHIRCLSGKKFFAKSAINAIRTTCSNTCDIAAGLHILFP